MEPTVATVTNLTEKKLRDILNFDYNLTELIHHGLWEQGIPPISPIGVAICKNISLDDLWKVVYDKMKSDHTEEEISHYIAVISKAQDTIQEAFAIIGKEVEDTIARNGGK